MKTVRELQNFAKSIIDADIETEKGSAYNILSQFQERDLEETVSYEEVLQSCENSSIFERWVKEFFNE